MSSEINKTSILSSLFWKLMERGGVQGIQFLVQVVLARLLSPDDFGTIAIVMIFITLASVFVQSGFNTALIQKKDVDAVDFSSVFYLSIFVAGVLYLLIYLTSPLVADFYHDPSLTLILRIISLTLFFGAFKSIQNAYIARNMLFKKLFYSSLSAILFSGVIGISFAYAGFGVWALVFQQLSNQITITVVMWFTVKWRPRLILSLKKVNELFSFGWKLLLSALIDTLYMELRTLVIGKIYSPSVLGYYNRGQQFPKLIVNNINGSIQSVMLPTLSAYQDNRFKVKSMMRRAIVSSSFIIFPMMIGMVVIAKPLVIIVLTDKWLPAVPFLQIFCLSYAMMPIHTANLQAINAMGRSDIFLKLEITKKVIGLIILGISLPFGVYAIAIGQVVNSLISTFINAYPNKQLLDYSYKEQLLDVIPSLLVAVIMGVIVSLFYFFSIPAWAILILQISAGIIIYTGLASVFKLESFNYLIITLKQLLFLRKKESS